MSSFSIAYRGVKAVALLAGATLICGFTFREGGPPELHYADYNAKPPMGNTVSVCHAHGCQQQEPFTFTGDDISDLSVLMDYARNWDTAPEERRAIAYAIAWMERRVGPSTGTANDRASLGFMNASGHFVFPLQNVKSEMPCVVADQPVTGCLLAVPAGNVFAGI